MCKYRQLDRRSQSDEPAAWLFMIARHADSHSFAAGGAGVRDLGDDAE
jgi:hypothetical protein